jgi:hypothetical protein
VPPERHSSQSSTSTREGESQCRFRVSPLARQNRLDSQSSPVQLGMGPTASGSFCNEILSSVAKILQLASRSGSRGYRCFPSGLEELVGLCSSSVVPHCSSSGKGSLPQSGIGPGNPMLPTQPWFPQLMERLADFPLVLPDRLQFQVVMPSPNRDCPVLTIPPQLVAWKVSGVSSEQKRFQKDLSTLSSPHGERRQMPHTTLRGIRSSQGFTVGKHPPCVQIAEGHIQPRGVARTLGVGFPANIAYVRNYACLRVRALAHRCVNDAGGR